MPKLTPLELANRTVFVVAVCVPAARAMPPPPVPPAAALMTTVPPAVPVEPLRVTFGPPEKYDGGMPCRSVCPAVLPSSTVEGGYRGTLVVPVR
jgi:hypothetical protein